MPICWIDETGFHRARLDEIKAMLEASYRGIHGLSIDVELESTDAQEIGIYAEIYSDLIQVVEDDYNGRSPSGAIGVGLARLVRLNGIKKNPAKFATGVVTLGGTIGTVIPALSRIGNGNDQTAVFTTDADATLVDDGGHVNGTASVSVTATVTGTVRGLAHELVLPLTVIRGWTTSDNAADVSPGDVGETDAQLRARRASSVALPSQGIVDGLRAALLQVPNVTQVVIRENPEDTVQTLLDGGTLAPHAIQVIALGGADAAIANAIWLKKSSGVTQVGATVTPIVDSQGVSHDMKYDRPADTDIYVTVNTPAALTTDEKTAIAQAIEDRGNGNLTIGGVPLEGSQIGENVTVSDVYDAITWLRVTTMPKLKVDEIDIGLTASPTTDAEVPVAFDHIATWAASRVTFLP